METRWKLNVAREKSQTRVGELNLIRGELVCLRVGRTHVRARKKQGGMDRGQTWLTPRLAAVRGA